MSIVLPDGITAANVRNQLAMILASESFLLSHRLNRFLEFIVEHELDGKTEPLKEYVIGLEVFDKDPSFDPRADSIVRVEAGRLRTKLRQYYAEEGRQDAIRIEVPKRSYAPIFQLLGQTLIDRRASDSSIIADNPPNQINFAPRRPLFWYGTAACFLALLIITGVYIWQNLESIKAISNRDDLAGVEVAPVQFSVAVLPLRNLTGKPIEEYFSDGMTDVLISNLAKVKPLRVISLTSVMAYKGTDKSLPEIARELNVVHIVEGSILRSADRIRITVQLIEAKTDYHIWAESYERDSKDVIALQRDMSWHIAKTLAGEILRSTEPEPVQPSSIDAASFEAYLKGRYFRNQLTADGFMKGLKYFRQTIEQEPRYAPAYSGMASCYCLLGGHGLELVPPREGMPKAKTAALAALALDDTLAEPYGVLGIIQTKYDWDWDNAEKSFRQALTLNPSFAQGHAWYSIYLEAMRRHEEAILEAERARQLNPLSLGTNVNLAWQLHQAGQDAESIKQLEKALELDPNFWGTHWALGHVYVRNGRYDEAIAELQKAVTLKGGHNLSLATLGYIYAVAGKRNEALKTLDDLLTRSKLNYVSPAHIASIYAGLGEKDQAFAWLEKAHQMRSRSLAWLNVAHEWDKLRSDIRFTDLLRKVGLAS